MGWHFYLRFLFGSANVLPQLKRIMPNHFFRMTQWWELALISWLSCYWVILLSYKCLLIGAPSLMIRNWMVRVFFFLKGNILEFKLLIDQIIFCQIYLPRFLKLQINKFPLIFFCLLVKTSVNKYYVSIHSYQWT